MPSLPDNPLLDDSFQSMGSLSSCYSSPLVRDWDVFDLDLPSVSSCSPRDIMAPIQVTLHSSSSTLQSIYSTRIPVMPSTNTELPGISDPVPSTITAPPRRSSLKRLFSTRFFSNTSSDLSPTPSASPTQRRRSWVESIKRLSHRKNSSHSSSPITTPSLSPCSSTRSSISMETPSDTHSTLKVLDQVSHQLHSSPVKKHFIKKWSSKYHGSLELLDVPLHQERIEKMIAFEAMLHTSETKYISLSSLE